MSSNLLVELVTEELPPKALKRLGDAFAGAVFDGLKGGGVLDATSRFKAFATPRRLAIYIRAVLAKASDRTVEQKLMPVAVARKPDGGWSDALRRKLAGSGRERLADVPANSKVGGESLVIKPDGKVETVFLRSIALGQPIERVLSDALGQAIAKLPIPKVMSYQLADGATTVKFVRPAHALVALHGDKVLEVSALGLAAGRITHGHRFQGVKNISLVRADEYESRLEQEGRVIADFDKRRADIGRQLAENAAALNASLGPDEDVAPLLDEVTGLVEWPTVYVGEFEADYLGVPQECLILTMRQNQKYFPLFDAAGKLINKFLIVSNMRLTDPKNIVTGNQRVIRPRLADARFFFETDKKTKLVDRVPRLASIVYHHKLGSQLDRAERVRALARAIAQLIGADPSLADRAALLAKADLVTSMVGEFPELQGIMGRYYALADGENPQVAAAIGEQYRTRFDENADPENLVSMSLFIANRVETLVGIWGIGLVPTGEKDPFGLRRAALGLIGGFEILGASARLLKQPFNLRLDDLLQQAFRLFKSGVISPGATSAIIDFVYERYRNHLATVFDRNVIDAVIAVRPPLDEVVPRIRAVAEFGSLPEAASLAAANKRVLNIIKKNESIGYKFLPPNRGKMTEPAEQELMDAVDRIGPIAAKRFEDGDYSGNLMLLASIKTNVDRFFDEVMVMVDDEEIRNNRAALLQQLGLLMNRVADISKLAA